MTKQTTSVVFFLYLKNKIISLFVIGLLTGWCQVECWNFSFRFISIVLCVHSSEPRWSEISPFAIYFVKITQNFRDHHKFISICLFIQAGKFKYYFRFHSFSYLLLRLSKGRKLKVMSDTSSDRLQYETLLNNVYYSNITLVLS